MHEVLKWKPMAASLIGFAVWHDVPWYYIAVGIGWKVLVIILYEKHGFWRRSWLGQRY